MTYLQLGIIAGLTVLLRLATVWGNREIGDIDILGLPALGVLSLLFVLVVAVTRWREQENLLVYGMIALAAVMINAALRIYDYARIFNVCESEGFGGFEKLCEATVFQTIFNIPFVVIAAIVLAFWAYRKRSASI